MNKLLCSLALFWGQLAVAAPQVATAVRSDNACMVRELYARTSQDGSSESVQAEAVAACVTWHRGVGAWYLLDRAARGEPVSPDTAVAQAALQRFRSTATLFVRRAATRCQALAQSECLAALGLSDVQD